MRILSAALLIVLMLVPHASPAGDTGCGPTADRFCRLSEYLALGRLNLHGVLIVRSGEPVFEWYGSGRDQPWGKVAGTYSYSEWTLHDVRSVSKSVVSLLVGIALDRGLIKDIDQSIFDYLPQYGDLRTPEKERITIRHLLTMTSGLVANEAVPYDNPSNSERLMAISADPYRYALARNMISPPGDRWAYDGGSTMLLSRILQNASGESPVEFARKNLFSPLGIGTFEWMTLRASGEPAAYGGLRLRPRDMATIGQLVVGMGSLQGRQIVSRAWIELSTTPRVDGWYPDRYAMHWWAGEADVSGRHFAWTYALGLGGQRIYILPSLDAVVVVTGGLYDDGNQLAAMRAFLTDQVLPVLPP